MLIYQKSDKASCENHRGISWVSIASRLFAGIVLSRLSGIGGRFTRDNLTGFRSGRDCIDQISTLQQILHYFCRPPISDIIDLQTAFVCVDPALAFIKECGIKHFTFLAEIELTFTAIFHPSYP